MAFEVHILTFPISIAAFSGATEIPLVKIPSAGGGITVLEAYMIGPSAGTAVGGLLVSLSNAGTPVLNGTVATFTTPGVTAAGVPIASTVGTPYVEDGLWLGYDQTSGTVPAGTYITLSYVMGRAA